MLYIRQKSDTSRSVTIFRSGVTDYKEALIYNRYLMQISQSRDNPVARWNHPEIYGPTPRLATGADSITTLTRAMQTLIFPAAQAWAKEAAGQPSEEWATGNVWAELEEGQKVEKLTPCYAITGAVRWPITYTRNRYRPSARASLTGQAARLCKTFEAHEFATIPLPV